MTEKLAAMKSLHQTNTGENIFKEVEKKLSQYNPKWNLLRSIITDDGEKYLESRKKA